MGRATLVPWQNQFDLMIDRFDVRSSMDAVDLADAADALEDRYADGDGGCLEASHSDANQGCGAGTLDGEEGIVATPVAETWDDGAREAMQPGNKYFETRFEAYRDILEARHHQLSETEHLEAISRFDDSHNPFSPQLEQPRRRPHASHHDTGSSNRGGGGGGGGGGAAIGFDYGSTGTVACPQLASVATIDGAGDKHEEEQQSSSSKGAVVQQQQQQHSSPQPAHVASDAANGSEDMNDTSHAHIDPLDLDLERKVSPACVCVCLWTPPFLP